MLFAPAVQVIVINAGEDEAGTLQPETGASQADDSNGDLIEEDKNLVEKDKAGEVQADGVDDGLMQ